jgi:HSP20 family protein
MKLVTSNRYNGTYGTPVYTPVLSLSRELDRLFESPFAQLLGDDVNGGFAPALELRENADTYAVSVELPGVDRKDVQVSLHEGVLTVSGERRQEIEAKEGEYFRTERRYGRFQRQVSLPAAVKAEAVKAAYKDGVLTITLPKTAEAKPRQIDIHAN